MQAEGARAEAHRLAGVVSHESAALVHGWAVARPPDRLVVTVPRNRNVAAERVAGVDLRWGLVTVDDVRDDVTSTAARCSTADEPCRGATRWRCGTPPPGRGCRPHS